jgi:MFS family permease
MMTKTSKRVDMWFLRGIYGLLLTLYPRAYRSEFGEELQTVFNLSLDDATGRFQVIMVFVRELAGLPKAIIYEHLRERRRSKMTGKFASRFDFAPGSWTESFAALAPFLLGMVMIILGYIGNFINFPLWFQVVLVILLWSLVLGLFLLGSVKGVPRWFMPYLGLPLPLIGLLLFNGLMEKLGGVWWYRLPWFLADFLQQGLFLTGLVLLVVLLLFVTKLIPNSKSFYERLRDDWTLLSFIIYGTMPLMLVFTYGDYKNEEPFMFLSLVSLAAGGCLYLRSYEPLKRFLYLYGGVALSMMVAAVGKAVLRDSSFPMAVSGSWQTEFMSTLITWLWLALIMLIPALFKLFSSQDGHPNAV